MIYLDHAATTFVLPQVVEKMNQVMTEVFGNPSSMHLMGMEAEKEITKVKSIIGAYLKCAKDEIYFTSGGTESNNLAIMGMAKAYQRNGKHIITTPIEHSSTLEVVKRLVEEGFEVSYVNVDAYGFVDVGHLESLIREDTVLVSVIHVNNELGTLQDLEEIGTRFKALCPQGKFHVDGVQSFCKIPLNLEKAQVDAYSFSGHKIHASKGIGGLYIKKGTLIKPMILGGSQQKGIRSGTENVPAIAGLGVAVDVLVPQMNQFQEHSKKLKTALIEGVQSLEHVLINSSMDAFAHHIVSLSFEGVRGEVLLHGLEEKGIYVSTGSACASNKKKVSYVLKAIGVSETALESGLRFSFDYSTTLEEIHETINSINQLVPVLRKFKRR